MKKIFIGLLVVFFLVVSAGFYLFGTPQNPGILVDDGNGNGSGNGAEQETRQGTTTVTSDKFGFSFTYPAGADGYTATGDDSDTSGNFVLGRSLVLTSDYEREPPENGEGPPTINVSVFRNDVNRSAEEWIRSHERANFNIAVDDTIETETIGGAEYKTYQWDGLYRTDAYVRKHGGYIYLFSAQFMDAQDRQRDDLRTILEGVEWSKPELLAHMAHGDIRISVPEANATVTSPLTVEGKARGYWLFEATAPVMLVDWDGRIIAESYIQAEGDWMTEEFVPVSGTLEFDVPPDAGGDFSRRGAVIFHRANPSGLPENDAAIEIPVRFEEPTE